VQADYGLQDGGAWSVWMLFRFDGNRLIEAITFEHESEARSYRVSQGD